MKYFLFVLVLFFSACSTKNYEITQTKIIIIKSPKLKFADIGYVRNSDKSIELELFSAGKAIEKITINHLICISEGCMSKSGFNKEYLVASYPDDILQHIILGREIYGGENLVKTQDGFTQHIKAWHVDITYKVTHHAILFKDKQNKIILKFKDTDE
jgi:thioredoxin-related protein